MANAIELLEKRKKTSTSLLNENLITQNAISKNKTYTTNSKKRIVDLLDNIDIYEDKESDECIPNYKFPEIRWDENTNVKNPDSMTDEEIKDKFQLLNNEIKEYKTEVCKHCFQTGKRGIAFDIPYFYKGDENWDSEIPIKGKDAERGCEGCAWYDFAEWRKHLINVIKK